MDHRKGKRAKGFCGWDGCWLLTKDDRYYCHSHGEHFYALRRARLARAEGATP